jgi:hypothetical protein
MDRRKLAIRPEVASMPDFTARVLKLVSDPGYKPVTLKAMSRRLEVGPDDYAEFRGTVKRLVKEGKLDVSRDKTLRRRASASSAPTPARRGRGSIRSTSIPTPPAMPPAATRSR